MTDTVPETARPPLNGRQLRRTWAEQPPRPWLAVSLLLILIAGYFTARGLTEAAAERRLILDGQEVQARIETVNAGRELQAVPAASQPVVELVAVGPDRAPIEPAQTFEGRLAPSPRAVRPGDVITIRVSPDDPNLWTSRSEPPGYGERIAAATFLWPLVLLTLLLAWWRRRQVVAAARDGTVREGRISDVRTTALAPGRLIARFSLADDPDRRLFECYIPAQPKPGKGDAIIVLSRPGRPNPPVLAARYRA